MYSRLLATTIVAAAVFSSAYATAAQLDQPRASIPQRRSVTCNHVRRMSLHVPVRSKSSRIGCPPSMPSRTSLIRNSTGS